MKAFTLDLFEQMKDTLRDIESDRDKHALRRWKDSIVAIRSVITTLKQYIVSYQFADVAEEILFFKEIQPQFYSYLIYYIRIVHIEAHMPVGSKEDKRQYLDAEMRQIKLFFAQTQDIYRYYRLEETILDHQYFRREGQPEMQMDDDAYLLYDLRFCTEVGYKIARIKANDMLTLFLDERMEEIETNRPVIHNTLEWKAKKVFLVELLYLLHAFGVFGKVKLKTIFDTVSVQWNCPLSNGYKTVEEIRIRKKVRFAFAEQLVATGERQMDEDDLKAR